MKPQVAGQFGLAIMASGTHPTASWRIPAGPKTRYEEMIEDLRVVGRRNMLWDACSRATAGSRQTLRCDVRDAALSAAFHRSRLPPRRSGKVGTYRTEGYRLAAYDELPRTGIPELFRTEDEYRSYVGTLTRSGVMPDESYIWWAMRPSMRHPTLELRAPDCCTICRRCRRGSLALPRARPVPFQRVGRCRRRDRFSIAP